MSDPSTWPINSYVHVPPELRAGLRIYSTAQRYEVAVALGRAMRLKLSDDPTAHTWSYLYGLVDPLVDAIQEGSMLLENRAPRIARKAMDPLDVGDLTHVLMELGWGSHKLPAVPVYALKDVLRDALADRMTGPIQRLMLDWSERGLFDLRPGGEL